jgi:hypothetical protein
MGLWPTEGDEQRLGPATTSVEPSHVLSAISKGEIEGCPRSRF